MFSQKSELTNWKSQDLAPLYKKLHNMTAVGSDSASSQRELNTSLSRELLNSVIGLICCRIWATENSGEGCPTTQGRALTKDM